MIKKTLLIISMLCSGLYLYAAKAGKIDEQLIRKTHSDIDSMAQAEYLFSKGDVKYDFTGNGLKLRMDYHYAIKIYGSEGEKYGEISIPEYANDRDKERVSGIKAYSYNIVNGKVVREELSKKDIFEEKTSEYLTRHKFAIPNVKPGTVIEVKYTKTSPFVYTIPKWYFQHDIPTISSEFSIGVPEFFTLTPVPSGFVPVSKDQSKRADRGYSITTYTLEAAQVPSMGDDDYVLNIDDYRGGIKYEIYSVKWPNQPIEYFSKSWQDIVTNLYENSEFRKAIEKEIKELQPQIAATDDMSDDEKIKYLYDYVKDSYEWDGYYGIYPNENSKKFVESKSGNIGNINLLLVNLLQKAGINAQPLLLKSRYDGLLNTNYPSLSELDYVVAHIAADGESMILDATEDQIPVGQLPSRAVNLYGILAHPTQAQVVNLSNPNKYRVVTVSDYQYDVENNKIHGQSKRVRMDYAASKFRLDLEKEEDDSQEEYADNQEADITDFNIENTYNITSTEGIDDPYDKVVLEYDEELYTCSQSIGDKIFIDALLDFGIKENPFTDVSREFPIFYNYKINTQSTILLQIPDGYTVESIPEEVIASLPDKKGQLFYQPTIQDDKIIITYRFKINDDIHFANEYAGLKMLYDMAVNKTKEKIVLTKA